MMAELTATDHKSLTTNLSIMVSFIILTIVKSMLIMVAELAAAGPKSFISCVLLDIP